VHSWKPAPVGKQMKGGVKNIEEAFTAGSPVRFWWVCQRALKHHCSSL